MATAQMKAEKQAQQIERRGNTVTMADGVTTIKVIPDVDPESIRSAATQDIMDAAGARSTLALFNMTAAGYRTYMRNEGQTLTMGGSKWTIAGLARNVAFSDVSLVFVLVAYSGGNPA